MTTSKARSRLNVVGLVAFAIITLACGGAGSDAALAANGWNFTGGQSVVQASPSTRTHKLKLFSSGGEFFVKVTLKNPAPAGWTVTLPPDPIRLSPPAINNVEVDAVVTIPAGVPNGELRLLEFVATQTSGAGAGKTAEQTLTVNVGSPVTGMVQVGDWSLPTNEAVETLLRITWGEATPWGTLMGIKDTNFAVPSAAGPGDAVVWFAPKSGGISLDPGDVDDVTLKLLPTTNKVAHSFTLTAFFNHPGGSVGKVLTKTFSPAVDVRYEITAIDYKMGVEVTEVDKTTSYDVRLTNMSAGRYTFSTVNLPGRFSATVTPAFIDVNAGDTVNVRVDVTRTSSGAFEDTEEFIFRAEHSVAAKDTATILLPIQSLRGN